MTSPVAFLTFAAKLVVRALGLGVAGDFLINVGPALVRDCLCYMGAGAARDSASGSAALLSSEELSRQLEAAARLTPDQLRRLIKEVVQDVAADQSAEVRRAVAAYLARVPKAVRRALRSADDPTGTSAPPGLTITCPEDLLSFLPPQIEVNSGGAVRVTLRVTAGEHAGHKFTFVGHDTFLVGRSPKAHFRPGGKDKYFSRLHFMIEVNPPICHLTDMGSRNGTYVNGQRVQAAELKDGDKIRAGRTVLRVRVKHLDPLRPAPPPPRVLPPPPPPPPSPAPLPPTQSLAGSAMPAIARRGPASPVECLVCHATPTPQGSSLCLGCQAEAGAQPQPAAGYQIVREIGRGGMGVVFLAVRAADQRLVALKSLQPGRSGTRAQVERFLREARILQGLDHPHIVPFREVKECGGEFFFAMEYVQGTDAARLVKSEGPLSVPRAVALLCPALQALDYAHAKGFVHRDVKPANLLVRSDRGAEQVFLADFGLARVYQASPLSGLTLSGDMGGTLAFMAPEQITQFRESRPAVDQYAAAASLYYLLTGRMIYDFPRDTSRRVLMIMHEDPIPIGRRRPGLPPALVEIIERGLAREPEARFPGVMEMRRALLPFAGR